MKCWLRYTVLFILFYFIFVLFPNNHNNNASCIVILFCEKYYLKYYLNCEVAYLYKSKYKYIAVIFFMSVRCVLFLLFSSVCCYYGHRAKLSAADFSFFIVAVF